jgi:heme o synthase
VTAWGCQRQAGIKNYLLVAKPGIVLGNSISVAGAFLMASRGCVDIGLLFTTLLGVCLAVASGCVFNNCIDMDVDRKMSRTRNRVLASGVMSPGAAVRYAILLGMAGMALLHTATNGLCVAIVLIGLAIYVGVYSLGLKRRSSYAVLIGSLAGAAPPLAGYCAVTARFDTGALILLAVFVIWQIPHAYAVAVYRREDFASAGIPALTVKRDVTTAKRHILIATIAFALAATMPSIGGFTGSRFLIVAATLGLVWLGMAWQGFGVSDDKRWARHLFLFSIVSITVLSVMMAVDFIPVATP